MTVFVTKYGNTCVTYDGTLLLPYRPLLYSNDTDKDF